MPTATVILGTTLSTYACTLSHEIQRSRLPELRLHFSKKTTALLTTAHSFNNSYSFCRSQAVVSSRPPPPPGSSYKVSILSTAYLMPRQKEEVMDLPLRSQKSSTSMRRWRAFSISGEVLARQGNAS